MEDLNQTQVNWKKSNFSTAFFFLNSERKQALSIFYNFSRYIDDIADSDIPQELKIKKLTEIKDKINKIYLNNVYRDEITTIREIINRYKIPRSCFTKLIDGMLYDCGYVDIKTQKELEEYMYMVAGVVGIVVLKISGYDGKDANDIARYTGYAVQLTNIIRDFHEDFYRGRIYIPKEHRLQILGNEKIEIQDKTKIKKLLNFEKNIAQNYYEISSTLIRKNKTSSLFVSSIMKNIYLEVLKSIDFEKLEKNHKISTWKRMKSFIKSIVEIYL